MSRLSWTAKRKGNKRCAPACGSGCTQKQYLEAKALGRKTKALLKTKGWKIRVWENGGWHVSLSKGTMTLFVRKYHGDEQLSFSTLMNFDNRYPGSGAPELSVDTPKTFTCPNEAVDAQIKVAKEYVDSMKSFIEMVEEMAA